ncbi:MAG: sulfatase, partial [Hyphomicrobiaceae bacterium]
MKLGAVGLAALGSPALAAARRQARPNILWLVSEDNNPFSGAYGDKLARTPNIDALAGKGVLYRHVYATAPVCAPSRFAILTGVNAQSCGPANHMRAVAHLPPALRTYPEYMRSAGYYCTNNSKTDYNCDVEPARIWNESSNKAHWRNRPPGTPFLAVFNYMTTHESMLFRVTPGRVKPDDVRVPAYLPDTQDIRTDISSYYNLMEKMDGQLGERLAELEADGLAEDTIIFYYSDNGGVLPWSKRYANEAGLRVAMTVYVPPKWQHLAGVKPGTVVNAPTSLLDLAPTLLSLANIPVPRTMQGYAFLGPRRAPAQRHAFGMRDRMDERYDFVRTLTDGRYRYVRNYMPHRQYGMHGGFEWQAKGYQDWERQNMAGRTNPAQARFFKPKPFEELYDRQGDPDGINNRIADPALASVLRRLRQALDQQILAINDNGFIPEGSPLEGWEPSRRPGAYPLRAIMALAAGAASGRPANLP